MSEMLNMPEYWKGKFEAEREARQGLVRALGRKGDEALRLERQLRDLALENKRLKARVAELESISA